MCLRDTEEKGSLKEILEQKDCLFEEEMASMTRQLSAPPWELGNTHDWPDNTGLFGHGFKCPTEARNPAPAAQNAWRPARGCLFTAHLSYPALPAVKKRSPCGGLRAETEARDLQWCSGTSLAACAGSKCGGAGKEVRCLSGSVWCSRTWEG